VQRSAACVWREVTWYVVDCVRHNYNEGRDTSKPRAYLTCAEFHKQTKILVAGFDDGSFTVHEMPHFNLLQSFTWVSLSRINLLQSFTWVSLSHINLLQSFTSVNFSSFCWRNLPLTRFHSLRWLKLRHVFYFYFYKIFVELESINFVSTVCQLPHNVASEAMETFLCFLYKFSINMNDCSCILLLFW